MRLPPAPTSHDVNSRAVEHWHRSRAMGVLSPAVPRSAQITDRCYRRNIVGLRDRERRPTDRREVRPRSTLRMIKSTVRKEKKGRNKRKRHFPLKPPKPSQPRTALRQKPQPRLDRGTVIRNPDELSGHARTEPRQPGGWGSADLRRSKHGTWDDDCRRNPAAAEDEEPAAAAAGARHPDA